MNTVHFGSITRYLDNKGKYDGDRWYDRRVQGHFIQNYKRQTSTEQASIEHEINAFQDIDGQMRDVGFWINDEETTDGSDYLEFLKAHGRNWADGEDKELLESLNLQFLEQQKAKGTKIIDVKV